MMCTYPACSFDAHVERLRPAPRAVRHVPPHPPEVDDVGPVGALAVALGGRHAAADQGADVVGGEDGRGDGFPVVETTLRENININTMFPKLQLVSIRRPYLVRHVVRLGALLAPEVLPDRRLRTRLHVADPLLPLSLAVRAHPGAVDGHGGLAIGVDGTDPGPEGDAAVATTGTRRPRAPVVAGKLDAGRGSNRLKVIGKCADYIICWNECARKLKRYQALDLPNSSRPICRLS